MEFTICQARKLSGYTQKEMADELLMSEKTYIQYEKYRSIFRMDHAHRFCKTTGIPLDKIIFFAA